MIYEQIWKQLSEELKIAFLAGCEMDYDFNYKTNILTISTKNPIAIIEHINGQIEVIEKKS